jgi:hypothetical protein
MPFAFAAAYTAVIVLDMLFFKMNDRARLGSLQFPFVMCVELCDFAMCPIKSGHGSRSTGTGASGAMIDWHRCEWSDD